MAKSSAVEFSHQGKLHIVILGYDLLKDNEKISKPMILGKTMTKVMYGNFKKVFSNAKKWLQERQTDNLYLSTMVIKTVQLMGSCVKTKPKNKVYA